MCHPPNKKQPCCERVQCLLCIKLWSNIAYCGLSCGLSCGEKIYINKCVHEQFQGYGVVLGIVRHKLACEANLMAIDHTTSERRARQTNTRSRTERLPLPIRVAIIVVCAGLSWTLVISIGMLLVRFCE